MASKTKFGFQLFSVHLHMRTARNTLDFSTAELEQSRTKFIDSMRSAVISLEDKTRVGELSYRDRGGDDEEDQKSGDTKPAIRVVNAVVTTQTRIDFKFRYGRIGSHDVAIAEDASEDAVLRGKASTNEFRASLYLPTSGERAILMVENRSNLCPVDYFLKHLSFHFRDIDDARLESAKQGWWRLMAKGITDSERLDEVLLQGRGAALQLEKYSPTADGRRRATMTIVRQDGLPAGKLNQVRALAYNWLGLRNPDADPSAVPPGNTSVEQVASLLDVQVIAGQFDDGAIVYDDGNGRTQTIRRHSVRDVFVYPVSEGTRPQPGEIRAAAEDRMRKLMPTLNIQVSI